MTSPETIADAARLQEILKDQPPEVVANEILQAFRRERIKGAIDACTAMLDSMPASVLELPPEHRQMLASIVLIIEGFQERLEGKLK